MCDNKNKIFYVEEHINKMHAQKVFKKKDVRNTSTIDNQEKFEKQGG
jgi:hypothetical protein